MPKLKIELKSVAKQVARAMLHVFLLQRVENDSTFYLHEGELHIKTCVQLAAFFFLGDKSHEQLLRVTAPLRVLLFSCYPGS